LPIPKVEHKIQTSKRYSLTVQSRVERLGEIGEFVERAARSCGLTEDQGYEAQMAVDEACTNVIAHAYRGHLNGKIEITCEQTGAEFVVTIRDWGKRFNPRRIAQPRTDDPLHRRKVGGLGLFFMYKMMDRVDFSFSKNEGNLLVMAKKIEK
jgi:serine/threonine-protein kinase RsbW